MFTPVVLNFAASTIDLGKELLSGKLFCTECANGKVSLAGRDCKYCTPGSFPTRDRAGCTPCSSGKYASTSTISDEEQCLRCPKGRYSAVEGIDSVSKCVRCPPGTFSNTTASSNETACLRCPEGRYASEYGKSICDSCKQPGVFCEKGATKMVRCDEAVEVCIDGTTAIRRPPFSESFEATRSGLQSIKVALPQVQGAAFHVELALLKISNIFLVNTSIRVASLDTTPGEKVVFFRKLNVNASYYVQLFQRNVSNGVLSLGSAWSDRILFPCPPGAVCRSPGNNESALDISFSEGVPINMVYAEVSPAHS